MTQSEGRKNACLDATVQADDGRMTLINDSHPAPPVPRRTAMSFTFFGRPITAALAWARPLAPRLLPFYMIATGIVFQLVTQYVPAALGLSDMAEDPSPPDVQEFPPGSTLLLYTDGLSEARDMSGTFYDPVTSLTGRTHATPEHLLSALSEDVRRFSGTDTFDDMALLAAHRPGEGPAAPAAGRGARGREAVVRRVPRTGQGRSRP
ncbi:SpoIIE family protein phosphatase [Streptomyces cyaneofuscatus]|uniref:SpoIIE family protein phosphatase n=1 Tax=Streptomyces cyaneofuscatus TaxID=66883 RepID=UPI0036506FCB